MNGACVRRIADIRAAAASLPARAVWNCGRRSTITFLFTFRDSARASAGVSLCSRPADLALAALTDSETPSVSTAPRPTSTAMSLKREPDPGSRTGPWTDICDPLFSSVPQ